MSCNSLKAEMCVFVFVCVCMVVGFEFEDRLRNWVYSCHFEPSV